MEPYSIEDELEDTMTEEDDDVTNDELDCVIEELKFWLLEEELTDDELATDEDDFAVNEELDKIAELDCSDSDEKLSDDESPIAEELSLMAELELSPSISTMVEWSVQERSASEVPRMKNIFCIIKILLKKRTL